MASCEKCFKQLPDDAAVCGYCGAPRSSQAAEPDRPKKTIFGFGAPIMPPVKPAEKKAGGVERAVPPAAVATAPSPKAPKALAPMAVTPKAMDPSDAEALVASEAKTMVPEQMMAPGQPSAEALAASEAKTLVPGQMMASEGAPSTGGGKQDMIAMAVGLPSPGPNIASEAQAVLPDPAMASQGLDASAETIVPGMAKAISPVDLQAPTLKGDEGVVPATDDAAPTIVPGAMAASDKTVVPDASMLPAFARSPAEPSSAPAAFAATDPAHPAVQVPAPAALRVGAPQTGAPQTAAPASPPVAAPATVVAPMVASPMAPPAKAPPEAASPAGAAPPMAASPMAAGGPTEAAPPVAPVASQMGGLKPAMTEEPMVLGSAATKASGFVGLNLAEDEHLIAVERPGAFFWILFGIFCALVITFPLALWMLLGTTGKAYVITNKRSIRISRGGKVTSLPHTELERFDLKGFMGASQVSLKLIPTAQSSGKPITFGLCGPGGALARLWGVLIFWVLGQATNAADAPEVDATGEFVDVGHPLDVAIFQKTWYRKGFDFSQAQRNGVTVMTPLRLIWLREEDIGSDGKVHATIPVLGFVLSAARRFSTVEAFEAELLRVGQSGEMAEAMSRGWDTIRDISYSRMKGLQFVDGKDGKKAMIYFPGKHQEQVRAYLAAHHIPLA